MKSSSFITVAFLSCLAFSINAVLATNTAAKSASKPSTAKPASKSKPSAGPIRDKWALVIGISKFANSSYDLKYSSKDALDFYNYLINDAHFSKDHVLLLLDEQATQRNIEDAFGDNFLPAVSEPGDMIVVYVSTHGTPAAKDKGGRNYIVAYDTNAAKLFSTGVKMDDLYQRIKEGVKTDRALIIMDTCFSGAGIPGAKGVEQFDNFDARQVAQGCGHRVITSSSPNERSWESKSSANGVFTKYLLQDLRSKNGRIDVKTAFSNLQEQVAWEVKNTFSVTQTPQLGGEWEGNELILSAPATKPRQVFNQQLLQLMNSGATLASLAPPVAVMKTPPPASAMPSAMPSMAPSAFPKAGSGSGMPTPMALSSPDYSQLAGRGRSGAAIPAPAMGVSQQISLLELEVFKKSYDKENLLNRLVRLESTVFPQDNPATNKSLSIPDRMSRLLAAVPISQAATSGGGVQGFPTLAPSTIAMGSGGASGGDTSNFAPLTESGSSGGGSSFGPSSGSSGAGLSKSAVRILSEVGDVNLGPYIGDFERRIKRAWFPPRGAESKRVTVIFKVHSHGELSDLRIEHSSGTAVADHAALQAVRNAAPFRPLPAGAPPAVVDIQFTFDYNVFHGGSGGPYAPFNGGRNF